MDDFVAPTDRTRLRRAAGRGTYDLATVEAILDTALVCHVGFALEGRPWVFPFAFVRRERHLYLHGAAANFGLKALATGAEACVTVTILDGLVLARSAFHHSVNSRSVMLFGQAEAVTDPVAKRAVLLALVERLVPGRSDDCRPPTAEELRRTSVVRLPVDELSAKVRIGGPNDEPGDLDLPYWAGDLPLHLTAGHPRADAGSSGLPVPSYLQDWPGTPVPAH
jgi:uncharacterized protein